MIIPKRLLSLRSLCGDSTRYAIRGIRFVRLHNGEPELCVTTGRYLLVTTWKEPDGNPSIPGAVDNRMPGFEETISFDDCKTLSQLCKMPPGLASRLPDLNSVVIDEKVKARKTQDGDKQKYLLAGATDATSKATMEIVAQEGEFPKYRDLSIPGKKTSVSVRLTLSLLAQLVEAMRKALPPEDIYDPTSTDYSAKVVLTVDKEDPGKAITLSVSRKTGEKMIGILMPAPKKKEELVDGIYIKRELPESGPAWSIPSNPEPKKEVAKPKPKAKTTRRKRK